MEFEAAITALRNICGIYRVIHSDTNRSYIGSSFNCGDRLKDHRRAATKGGHGCLHRALSQFGISAFKCELVEECDRPGLLDREEHWIAFHDSAGVNGFNTLSKSAASFGWKMPQATIDRMRAAAIKSNTPEKRKRISQALTGRTRPPMSAEWKEKLRQAGMGRVFTPESRAKISRALTGKKLSDAHRKHVGDARRGKPQTPEWKEKVRLSLLGNKRMQGKTLTPEHRAKISAGCKGKGLGVKLSDEHRRKLSEAHSGKPWTVIRRSVSGAARERRVLQREAQMIL